MWESMRVWEWESMGVGDVGEYGSMGVGEYGRGRVGEYERNEALRDFRAQVYGYAWRCLNRDVPFVSRKR